MAITVNSTKKSKIIQITDTVNKTGLQLYPETTDDQVKLELTQSSNTKNAYGSTDTTLRALMGTLATDIGGKAPSTHSHGNLASGGTLNSTATAITSGATLVIAVPSDYGIARSSISFDASTTSKALTPKGTWETFLQSHQSWGFSISNGTVSLGTGTGYETTSFTKTSIGLSNVENTKLSTWAGSSYITTLGTISTGTWQGTKIGLTYGGTGATDAAGARTNLGLGTAATYTVETSSLGSNSKLPTSSVVKNYVDSMVSSGVQYLGVATDITASTGELDGADNPSHEGDWARVGSEFGVSGEVAHVGDILIYESGAGTAQSPYVWDVLHTESDTDTNTYYTATVTSGVEIAARAGTALGAAKLYVPKAATSTLGVVKSGTASADLRTVGVAIDANSAMTVNAAAWVLNLIGATKGALIVGSGSAGATDVSILTPGTSGKYLKSAGTNGLTWDTPTDTNNYITGLTWAQDASGVTGTITRSGLADLSVLTIPSATAAYAGIVNTSAQTFAGKKTFNGGAEVPQGSGTCGVDLSNAGIGLKKTSGNATHTYQLKPYPSAPTSSTTYDIQLPPKSCTLATVADTFYDGSGTGPITVTVNTHSGNGKTFAITHDDSTVSPGSYSAVTVNATGHVTVGKQVLAVMASSSTDYSALADGGIVFETTS